MARIVWMSDAPAHPTGFGLVTREICRRLGQGGHEVRILGWWAPPTALGDGVEVHACPVSPEGASQAIAATIAAFKPQLLVTLADIPWVGYLAQPAMRGLLDAHGVPWCAHYPIDGARPDGRMPPAWADILRQADLPLAMSRYGQAVSRHSGVAAACIPHGCDTALFRPPPDKAAAKARLGLAGCFVILCDARNHRRKLLPRLLDIFRRFAMGKPEVRLVLNANLGVEDDAESYRYDLIADIAALGLTEKVHLPRRDGPLAMPALAALYAAADLHLLASQGEGFGLPTLQAAAAGVVPLAGDHSSNRELLGDHGIALPDTGTALDEFGLERAYLDPDQTLSALGALYRDPAGLAARALRGQAFAANYDWARLMPAWEALLRSARLRPDRPAPQPAGPASARRPSGHDAHALPVPRLCVPVRLSGTDGLALLTDPASAETLAPLAAIFPGLRVETDGAAAWHRGFSGVLLVFDPAGRLGEGLRLACLERGIFHLGPAQAAPDPAGWRSQLRQLLTDQILAERHLAAAFPGPGCGAAVQPQEMEA